MKSSDKKHLKEQEVATYVKNPKTSDSNEVIEEKWLHGCRIFYQNGKVDVELCEDFEKNGMTPQQMGDLIIAEMEMENKYGL